MSHPHLHPPEWLALRPWQRHSLVLTVAGIVYIAIGWVYLAVPLTLDRRDGLKLALEWSHGHIRPWGVVWVIVGLLAIISTRWPPASKTWGYSVLSALAAMWSGFYLVAVTFLHVPHAGYSGALVWGLVAFLWWAISGLVNPDDVVLNERR